MNSFIFDLALDPVQHAAFAVCWQLLGRAAIDQIMSHSACSDRFEFREGLLHGA